MNDQVSTSNDDEIDPAARPAGHQPALTGCPWHDVNEMLQAAGLRPTRQRMALGWLLFGKGARHLTAEMLYEEATLAKVPVSLATVYNTLNQLTDAGLLRQVRSTAPRPISTPTSPRITTFTSRTTTSWSIFPIRIWCCRDAGSAGRLRNRPRRHGRAAAQEALSDSCESRNPEPSTSMRLFREGLVPRAHIDEHGVWPRAGTTNQFIFSSA